MVININLDISSEKELDELAGALKLSKSKLIRLAIKDLYLKEKRAENNLGFFIDLYNENIIGKEMLFLLLPRDDAQSVIIGSKFGKEAAKIVKENFNN